MKETKIFILFCFFIFSASCSSPANYTYVTPTILTPIEHSKIQDRRTDFYKIFCSIVKDNCSDYLFYERTKSTSTSTSTLKNTGKKHKKAMRIVIVPGIFGECMDDEVLPFMYSSLSIEKKYPWVTIETIKHLNGRASSSYNSREIKNYFDNIKLKSNEELFIISYSKGTTDILYYLENLYFGTPKISSLVSISGVVMGTPVADLVGKSGDYLAKSIPIPTCPSQDDSGIPSLTLKNQINWLAKSNRAFNHNINMYSIVSLSKNKNTSKIFKSTHYYLNKTQGVNDGQVAGSSQILPNSSLLGYFNADHWAIILPFENTDKNKLNSKNKIIKNLANKNKFPREALLESIVILLDRQNSN